MSIIHKHKEIKRFFTDTMNVKHLQLNTETLQYPKKIMEYVVTNEIDIACLQEICYSSDSMSPLVTLVESSKYNYTEGVHYYYKPQNMNVGIAVVSRWPVIDYVSYYYNTDSFNPKVIKESDLIGGNLLTDKQEREFSESRGLKHSVKSRCILCVLIETPKGLLRVITTHNNVSSLCTETIQMYEMAQLINSVVRHSKSMPTIFSADLNIRPQSFSVEKISEVMSCHTKKFKDTLARTHVAKTKDFPKGLAIDHVFSKGLKHKGTSTVEVDFSHHKAVVSEFSLK